MKHLRLCLMALIISASAISVIAQTFDPKEYEGRDNFFKNVFLSKEFHSRSKMQCRNINSRFVLWQYADTVDFDLQKVHVFTYDGRADSIRLDTIFTQADRNHIMRQFNYYRGQGRTWEYCASWRVLVLTNKRSTNLPYWEFSYPLYSMDYTKCLVRMNYYKAESDYLMSTVLFYKNKKGFWKEKAVIRLNSPGGK